MQSVALAVCFIFALRLHGAQFLSSLVNRHSVVLGAVKGLLDTLKFQRSLIQVLVFVLFQCTYLCHQSHRVSTMQLFSVLDPICDNVRSWKEMRKQCASTDKPAKLSWENKRGNRKKQHYAGKKYMLGKAILSSSGRNFLLLVRALLGSVELCSCKTASAEAQNCLHSACELCGLPPSSIHTLGMDKMPCKLIFAQVNQLQQTVSWRSSPLASPSKNILLHGAHQHFSLTKSTGCVFRVLCGCLTHVAQVSSYDPSWRLI